MEEYRDLPVAIDLPEPLAGEVAAWIEQEAGWQVVGPSGPPAPALVIAEAVRPGRRCVVVLQGKPGMDSVRAALRDGAIDVVGWPHERQRLIAAAGRDDPRHTDLAGPGLFRVAGTGGGAGTSTVALAVGGLLAWAGKDVLVVGGDDLLGLCGMGPWQGPGTLEIAGLDPADAGREVDGLARGVAGVDRLRALGGGARLAGTAGWPGDRVVADDGVWKTSAPVDLLVSRPDRTLARAPSGVPVLVTGDGPLDSPGVRRLLGRRPVGWLPASARVANAGLRGRVPGALPGSWLQSLAEALGQAARGERS